MTFSKVVDADANTFLPSETINFTVSAATASSGETYNNEPVYSGSGTITAAPVTVNPADRGKQTYSSTLDFSSLSFNKPGIYKYTVTETAGSNKDMTYDSTPRTLYVYVEWTDENMTATRVYGAAMTKAGSTEKSANFDNEYKKSNQTGEEFKDLTIKKTVSGAQADKDKLFTFNVTITSGPGRTTYVVHKPGDSSDQTLTAGTPYTFDLKHNETITIENLSTNDTYTVEETADSKKGYTATGEVTTATNMPAADTTVTVNNEKKSVTPTGIFMSYAPYIAMIAAAAALALVFRRRREEI